MNRVSSTAVVAMVAGVVMCFGQNPAAAPVAPQSHVVGHGAFPVKVTKTLDSSKLKEGDAIEFETVGSFRLADSTLVPKGSKLTGHVAASKARSKGDAISELTLTLDNLIAGGKRLSIKGVVQAVFPPQEEAAPMMAGKASGAAGGGYSPGGNGAGYAAGTMGTVTNERPGSDTVSGKQDPASDPKSEGVHGIHDLELGQQGEILSSGKQVKLASGVRMIVRAEFMD